MRFAARSSSDGVTYEVVPFAKGTEIGCVPENALAFGPYEVVPFAKGTEITPGFPDTKQITWLTKLSPSRRGLKLTFG